jgi:hypothetical protein
MGVVLVGTHTSPTKLLANISLKSAVKVLQKRNSRYEFNIASFHSDTSILRGA